MMKLLALLILAAPLFAEEQEDAPLIAACWKGDLDKVKERLDKGDSIEMRDEFDRTPLMMAAGARRLELVKLLLARGADVTATANGGECALCEATGSLSGISRKDLEAAPPEALAELREMLKRQAVLIEVLIKAGANPNESKDGQPPLIGALEPVTLPLAEALLEQGASLQHKIGDRTLGALALQAITRESDAEVLSFLLKRGAKPDREALWFAVEKNHSAFALRFIQAGADITGTFGGEWEAAPLLVHAAKLGNAMLVDALLQAGADVNLPDKDGDTALAVTVRRSKNLRPDTMVGAPSWARSSSLADYERSSRNFVATAQVLVAAGAKTDNPPEIPDEFVAFLRVLGARLAERDFLGFAALTCTEEGDVDPKAIVGHPHFDAVFLPVVAQMRTMLDQTLRTRDLWIRGVYPRGAAKVQVEGDRAGLGIGTRSMRFARRDGQWRLIGPPLSYFDTAMAKRKADARTLQREFQNLSAAGYFEAAIGRGRALLKCEDLKERDRFIVTWALGNAEVGAGHYDAAQEHLTAALELATESFRWVPLESLTALACLRGDMDKAKAYAAELQREMRKVIAEFKSDDRHRRSMMWARFVQTYSNLGAALTIAGRHDEARAVLEEARTAVSRAEGGAAPTAIYVSMQLANLYGMTGQTESALSAYAELWKSIENGTGPTTAVAVQVQTNLSSLNQMRGDAAAARTHMEQALQIGRGVYGTTPELGLLFIQNGGVLLQEGDAKAAGASYARAQKILEGSGNGALSQAVLGRAACAIASDKLDEAVPLLDRAAQLTSESYGAGHRNMVMVHAAKAGLLRRKNDLDGARTEILKAVAIVERERGQLRNDFDRRRYLAMVQGLYGALGAVCLEAGLQEQVFEAVERHKAKSLMELVARKRFVPRQGADDIAAIEALDEQARRASPRKLDSLDDGARSGFVAAPTVDAARHEILQRLRKLNPELAALVTVTWPTVKDVQATLDPDTRLIEFHALESNVIAIAIGPKSLRVVKLAVDPATLDETAAAFVRSVSDRDSPLENVHRLGGELYDQLLRPLAADLKDAKTLVVVPYGKLHYVPFGALYDGEQYLTDRYRLVSTPSAGIYRMLKQRQTKQTSGFLALADPASYLKRLPGAEYEVAEIRAYFPSSTVHGGEQATEQTLKGMKSPPRVFHYAGHGVFDANAPELSHLALAPAGDDNGRLEAHEIHGLDFTGTRLVVLSACQGATGELGGGDEIVGLVRPFLATGAGAVIASLWNVDDNATARWMAQFYERFAKEGMHPAEAVRKAQARVRKSSLYKHPYFWAAFQLYGAPQTTR